MRAMILRRLLCVLMVVGGMVSIGYHGGTVSYLLFWMTVLIPLLALIYRWIIRQHFLVAFRIKDHTVLRGEMTTGVLTMTNDSLLPIADIRLRLSDGKVRFLCKQDCYTLLPGETKQVAFEVNCLHCGDTVAGAEEILVGDLLGLSRSKFTAVEKMSILPRTEHLTDLVIAPVRQIERQSVSRSYYGDTIPDGQLKPYLPGEDIRRIHWKVSQLQGRPILRNVVPEPKTEVVLIPDGRANLPEGQARWLAEDSIIEGTLAIADYFMRSNIAVRVIAGTDRVENVFSPSHYLKLYQMCANGFFSGNESPDALMELELASRSANRSYIILTWDINEQFMYRCSTCMDAGAEITVVYVGEALDIRTLAAADRRMTFYQVTSQQDIFSVLSGRKTKEGVAE
ncbi:MAG: DUF58 domain-containing protein [Oscillospiraceae bacterium]|nr:DUF58 domain-containing protein [Oscillospiraceae bacterium]